MLHVSRLVHLAVVLQRWWWCNVHGHIQHTPAHHIAYSHVCYSCMRIYAHLSCSSPLSTLHSQLSSLSHTYVLPLLVLQSCSGISVRGLEAFLISAG